MLRRVYGSFLYKRALKAATEENFSKAHRYLMQSANIGNTLSQYKLGLYYLTGVGCNRSGIDAVTWFERAAHGGNADAQFELGVSRLRDRDEVWCVGAAADWALKRGVEEGRLRKDFIFPYGVFLEKDEKEAFRWIKLAAESGKPEAQTNLGFLFMNGIGCTIDLSAAKHWLELAVEQGIASAAFGLAELYAGFKGYPSNDATRFEWLVRAAELGHTPAMYRLGRIHSSVSVYKSIDKAIYYFNAASEKGHELASLELSKILIKIGGTENLANAEEKLRLSVKLGNAEAALIIGQFYYNGISVTKDYRQAFSWFRVASDRGSLNAQFQLACMCAQGRGVPKDLLRATYYFEKCASRGHGKAAFNLGVFYEKGESVNKSREEAIRWFGVAASAGVSEAKVRLARLVISNPADWGNSSQSLVLLEAAAADGLIDAKLELARYFVDGPNADVHVDRVSNLLLFALRKGSMEAAAFILSLCHKGFLSAEHILVSLEFFENAANNGSIAAQLYLAELYDLGIIVPKSTILTEKWLSMAASNVLDMSSSLFTIANFRLGVFYCKRNLAEDDLAKAAIFYAVAANNGHAISQYNLGMMYLNGTGVSLDRSLSAKWFSRYVDQGNTLDESIINKLGLGSEPNRDITCDS